MDKLVPEMLLGLYNLTDQLQRGEKLDLASRTGRDGRRVADVLKDYKSWLDENHGALVCHFGVKPVLNFIRKCENCVGGLFESKTRKRFARVRFLPCVKYRSRRNPKGRDR
jgi:hypothetical protein